MKTKTMLLLFVFAATGQLMAGNEISTAPANTKTQVGRLQSARPQTPAATENRDRPHAGTSSQPWPQIVGWHPGEPAPLMDAKTHEPKFNLLQISFGPQS